MHDYTGGVLGTLLEDYDYDANGNRKKAYSKHPWGVPLETSLGSGIGCPEATDSNAATVQDQPCHYLGREYTYNDRGQLESKEEGDFKTTYAYDGLGRLHCVNEPGLDVRYVHDALGRRIGKLRDGSLVKGWLYADALNPIPQLEENGELEAVFLYGSRAHVPDAMVMTDGTTYRLVTDHLGSVRLVVNVTDGAVAQRLDYDAFGRVPNDTSPGFQRFGFTGGLYDDDTGLVRFGARDYDAHAGRWTAKHPILFGGGQANLYAYVGNDPIDLIDPRGADLDDWHGFPSADEHRNRNAYNVCPAKAPAGDICEDGRTLEFDDSLGDKFRGSDGSECKYDANGNLIESESTFNSEADYRGGSIPLFRHIWKDVIPEFYYGHELSPFPTLVY